MGGCTLPHADSRQRRAQLAKRELEIPPKPRVLIVITLAEVGGAQTYVAALVRALVGSFDVVVAAHGPGFLRGAVTDAGARYVPLSHVRRPVRPWRDVLGVIELARICRRESPALVHANSSKAGVLGRIAARIAGVPIRVFTVHGWAFKAHAGLAALAYRYTDRLIEPITTMTVCVSEHDRQRGLAARTCTESRSVVIRNAVGLEGRPQARHEGRGIPRLMMTGRLKAPKDVPTLLRALAALEAGSFTAAVVGSGPEALSLESEIARLGLTDVVELAGERDDVPARLADSDVFVLSSRSEGLPLSILEAMAAGLPVVASDVGGVPELVEEGVTGFLVPPGDSEALADALRRLVADGALRRRLGEAGRQRVATQFDLSTFDRAHVDLFHSLLEHHAASESKRRR